MNPTTAFVDVLVVSFFDRKAKKVRVKPLPGQPAPSDLLVRCSHQARQQFPLGTVYKMDLCLKQGKRGKPFLVARTGKAMNRALEYFEHNRWIQQIC
jgi:hypothetical protein